MNLDRCKNWIAPVVSSDVVMWGSPGPLQSSTLHTQHTYNWCQVAAPDCFYNWSSTLEPQHPRDVQQIRDRWRGAGSYWPVTSCSSPGQLIASLELQNQDDHHFITCSVICSTAIILLSCSCVLISLLVLIISASKCLYTICLDYLIVKK